MENKQQNVTFKTTYTNDCNKYKWIKNPIKRDCQVGKK